MVANGSRILASSSMRRHNDSVRRQKLQAGSLKRNHSRQQLNVFGLTPKVLYNPFALLSSCEQRFLRQSLVRVHKFVTQTVQDGLLKSLFSLFSKRKNSNKMTQMHHATQRQTRRCRAKAKRCWEKALQCERAMKVKEAIVYAERAAELQPENIEYLALLSKQYTDMSFVPGISTEEARELNKKALAVAEKILFLDPKSTIGWIAHGAVTGRLAYFSDNRTKVQLAKEAEESIHAILARDEKCDLGHYLNGRFQYEMAGLSFVCRALVRIVFGKTLTKGSYSEALDSALKAHDINPDRLIHKILIAKTYEKLGEEDQALKALEDALRSEITDINDFNEHLDGVELQKALTLKTMQRGSGNESI